MTKTGALDNGREMVEAAVTGAVKSRKTSIYLAPIWQRLHLCELIMLSRLSQFWSEVMGSYFQIFSCFHLFISFVLPFFFSFTPAFGLVEIFTCVSLIFIFPDGFYLVFLDFCFVSFSFQTPDFYSSEAT